MLESDFAAAAQTSGSARDELVRSIASHEDEALALATRTLRTPPQTRWDVALRIIRQVGYPRNREALPAVVEHLADPNWIGWDQAVGILTDADRAVAVRYLVRALLNRDSDPEHWPDMVEGICAMLCNVDRVYASLCAPSVVFVLTQAICSGTPDPSWLMDVLRHAGSKSYSFAVPALIALVGKEGETELGLEAQSLIQSLELADLDPYTFLLDDVTKPDVH